MIEIDRLERRRAMRQLTYEVIIPSEHSRGAGVWCEQQFGKRWSPLDCRDGAWAMFWAGVDMHKNYRFCFAEEQDAMLFSLRWL